ncbi:response regulator transcription factor [Paraconexibacter antarcticus]|uniref:Response regulator transcription factor n=1 Tax=Paraconexibacter antarcticus TaxID=2949664 RepID=A0ABY5DQH2_9ACTN|nr:response regulator transcription factor [Paraconexibacter antarcticus]UTI63047.1 response regulator transcription factor [Paraconexibacter antarcticus]
MSLIRILLADDHALVRHGLRLTLEAEPDFLVAAEAADGAAAVREVLSQPIDLAVLDVSMPLLTGLQAARQLSEQRPDLKILMLSMHDNEQFFFEALRAGASGYVLKSAAHQDLVAACRGALRGEPFLYPRGVAALVREYLERGPDAELPDPLSGRETEVVKLIAEGLSGREIADLLHISEKTVERHRSNVLDKLGLRDRVALTRYAIRRGLVEP